MTTCYPATVSTSCPNTDEVDAFKCGSSESIPCNFKNIFNEILIPYPEKCFAAFQSCGSQEETDGSQPIFFLKKYKELALHSRGLAVAITFKENNKNYVVSVNSDSSIAFNQCELPRDISGVQSDIIFYQKVFRQEHPNSFRFESSLKQNFYLGFSADADDNNKKLVLKHLPRDYLDETIMFTFV
ncbi:interleukin-18-like [Rana temporaria]|uniref:interleukin-18-like n=1 Tax=Rana temporaria TaxID=8407 RepID=UPI001AAE0150|nr:interleukin-18-like [Rana temporaria]